jgi:hypothetical protein
MLGKVLFLGTEPASSLANDLITALAAPVDALVNMGFATPLFESPLNYVWGIVTNPSALLGTGLIVVVYYLADRRLLFPLKNLSDALAAAISEGSTAEAPSASLDRRARILALADRVEQIENLVADERRTRVAWQLRRFEKAWRENVLEDVGDSLVSTACPSDYLSIERLLPAAFGFAAIRAVPGAMTSLGILGTFIGLSIGVSGLSLDLRTPAVDSAALTAPVLDLLSGMTTAFSTSIMGIVLALRWMVRERYSMRLAERQSETLVAQIEDLFPSVGPDGAWFYALRIAAEQKNTVKSLGTDIATRVVEGLDLSFQTHLVPQIAQMGEIIDKVANLSGAAQIEGMEKMVERFGDLLGDRMRSQFDNLANTIESLCAWQNETKQSLDQVLVRLRETTEVQDHMMATSSRAAELFQTSLGELGEMHQRLSGALESFRNLGDQMRELSAETQANQAPLFDRMQGLQVALQGAMEDLSRLTTTHQSAVDAQLQRVGTLMEASGRQASALDERLSASMAKFVEDCRQGVQITFGQFDEQLGKLAATLSGTVHETEETVRELSAKLHTIDQTVGHFDGSLVALEATTRRFVTTVERLSGGENGNAAKGDPHEARSRSGTDERTFEERPALVPMSPPGGDVQN